MRRRRRCVTARREASFTPDADLLRPEIHRQIERMFDRISVAPDEQETHIHGVEWPTHLLWHSQLFAAGSPR